MKRKRNRKLLFAVPGVAMLILGFGLMLSAALGGRLASAEAFTLPVGFTTAAVGGMLLTRTPLAVFFLSLFALAGLILAVRTTGPVHPLPVVFAALLVYCLPLAKHSKA